MGHLSWTLLLQDLAAAKDTQSARLFVDNSETGAVSLLFFPFVL